MIYKMTMEKVLLIGIEFEAADNEVAIRRAGEIFEKAVNSPEKFESGDAQYDYALCDDRGRDIISFR